MPNKYTDEMKEIVMDDLDDKLEESLESLERTKKEAKKYLDTMMAGFYDTLGTERVESIDPVMDAKVKAYYDSVQEQFDKATKEPEYSKTFHTENNVPMKDSKAVETEAQARLVSFEEKKREMYSNGKETSVKPTVVSNLYKMGRISKKQLAIFIAMVGATAGIVLGSQALQLLGEKATANKTYKKAMEEYYDEFSKSRSPITVVDEKAQFSYKKQTLLSYLKEKYDDPLISFYIYYDHFMQYEAEYLEEYSYSIISSFNSTFGTDFKSLEEVLDRYHFEDMRDFTNYVKRQLVAIEEREARRV